MSRLSCYIMALNEEECIARAIESVLPFVDELVVYDTGSTDRTLEIAKSYNGVTCVNGIWENHFSNARNMALTLLHGEWVLQLDADEYYDKENAARFRTLIVEGDKNDWDAYEFLCQSFVEGKHWSLFVDDRKRRLFRNYCKYVGRLHEYIAGYNNSKKVNIVLRHEKKWIWQDLDTYRYGKIKQMMVDAGEPITWVG